MSSDNKTRCQRYQKNIQTHHSKIRSQWNDKRKTTTKWRTGGFSYQPSWFSCENISGNKSNSIGHIRGNEEFWPILVYFLQKGELDGG